MNVVFLSPHFPPHWYRFAVALRAVGATTLGIADVDEDQLVPELREALHDYYRVGDLADYDQLTRALGWFINRHGRIDRIDSLNEHWLETEAALRTDFNIPGINSATIGAIKRKSVMKQRFIDAGLAPGPYGATSVMVARLRQSCASSSPRLACRSWPSPTWASVPPARSRSRTKPSWRPTWPTSHRPTTSSRSSSTAS